MLGLPNEKKWQIYCSQRGTADDGGGGGGGGPGSRRHGNPRSALDTQPEPYIEKVNALAMVSATYSICHKKVMDRLRDPVL